MKSSDDGIITLFSSKTAESFKSELISMECREYCKYKNLIVLSKQIFNKVSELKFKQVEVTDKPNLDSAIERIEQFLDGVKS
jgi:uroporphyrinogen-III synthase